jgi:nitrous oxide reductase accessory protein NosL
MGKAALTGILASILFFLAGAPTKAQEDIGRHPECEFCGMSRKGYGYSRMLVRYADGSEKGVCSLHCAIVDIEENPGKVVQSLLVADRNNRELIDAEAAFWVIGGRKRGVMTAEPKWAFGSRAAAAEFVSAYGGKIVPWPEVLAAAKEGYRKCGRSGRCGP